MIGCCCLSLFLSLYSCRPTFTEKDVDDIVNFGIKHKVDFIAASFVRKESDVKNLRQLLAENGGQDIKIICKIENQEGLENYNGILQATDAIMVARGDLGMEIPPSKVFLAQKMMIREANLMGTLLFMLLDCPLYTWHFCFSYYTPDVSRRFDDLTVYRQTRHYGHSNARVND